MGLTKSSVGTGTFDNGFTEIKKGSNDIVVALAGNPNVGKSTMFNALTGLKQHTGNWSGKTVTNAIGYCNTKKHNYIFVDIPGTYSLFSHSREEEIARDYICFGNPDFVVVFCDATCLERNLNLVLQIIETGSKVIVCINFMDEAKRKGIEVNLQFLSEQLGVPVIGCVARNKKDRDKLLNALDTYSSDYGIKISYNAAIESAVSIIQHEISKIVPDEVKSRWLSLRLIDGSNSLKTKIRAFLEDLDQNIFNRISVLEEILSKDQIITNNTDLAANTIVKKAEEIARNTVKYKKIGYSKTDRVLDRIFTGKLTAFPIMILLLSFIFWLTITAANVPSDYLFNIFSVFRGKVGIFFDNIGMPEWLNSMIVDGGLNVLFWVVAVMLPPMAIFFPLFTILEDSGYLPRIAYNLDKPFRKCNACGKQALTMCMGFGCNAAGVVGCRIINSPRERILAIITNNFVPCNGRFPTLIAIITMFFVGLSSSLTNSILSSILLTIIIIFGVFMTFIVTKLLSKTLLKGIPSSFVLEMPPYRRPQFMQVAVHSVFDRTLFVLGRAAAVAAPVGILIWTVANVKIGEVSILKHCADFLDPFAQLMGLDGVILMAFILGFPANEIVIPITIMAYLSNGSISDSITLSEMHTLFSENGWTWTTAISTMLFSLMHWPCSTTLITIKKETGSIKWTIAAFLIPTFCGVAICILFNVIVNVIL